MIGWKWKQYNDILIFSKYLDNTKTFLDFKEKNKRYFVVDWKIKILIYPKIGWFGLHQKEPSRFISQTGVISLNCHWNRVPYPLNRQVWSVWIVVETVCPCRLFCILTTLYFQRLYYYPIKGPSPTSEAKLITKDPYRVK